MNLPARFVLDEAQMKSAPRKGPRLRYTSTEAVRDEARDWIKSASVIDLRRLEEPAQIAPCGKANTQGAGVD